MTSQEIQIFQKPEKQTINFTAPGYILDQFETCLRVNEKNLCTGHMINKAQNCPAHSKQILSKPKRRSKNFYDSRYRHFGKALLTSDS